MKKIISLILCVMLVVTMIPGMAFAETMPEAGPDWTFGNVPADTVLSDNMKPTEGKMARTFRLDPGSDASFEIFGYYNHGEGNLDAQVRVYSVTETVDEGITTATGQYLTDSAIQFDPQDGRYQFVPRYKNNSTGAESVLTFERQALLHCDRNKRSNAERHDWYR